MPHLETPAGVDNRVFHEQAIPPGSICRTYQDGDGGERHPADWFAVVSPPIPSQTTDGEYIWIVWLEGDDEGTVDKYFLDDLGVHPPHRCVCEKHDLQLPEQYIQPPAESPASNPIPGPNTIFWIGAVITLLVTAGAFIWFVHHV